MVAADWGQEGGRMLKLHLIRGLLSHPSRPLPCAPTRFIDVAFHSGKDTHRAGELRAWKWCTTLIQLHKSNDLYLITISQITVSRPPRKRLYHWFNAQNYTNHIMHYMHLIHLITIVSPAFIYIKHKWKPEKQHYDNFFYQATVPGG